MKRLCCLLVLTVVWIGAAVAADAQPMDYPLLSRGEYFTIHAYPGMDAQQFLEKINFESLVPLMEGMTPAQSPRELAAQAMDAVYQEVSDVLGISAYFVEGDIRVFPDRKTLSQEFQALFGRGFEERACYVHETGTVYLSFEDLTLGVLSHEMAHVLMSHYFVIPPSPRLQEILSGYIEYHFLKVLAGSGEG